VDDPQHDERCAQQTLQAATELRAARAGHCYHAVASWPPRCRYPRRLLPLLRLLFHPDLVHWSQPDRSRRFPRPLIFQLTPLDSTRVPIPRWWLAVLAGTSSDQVALGEGSWPIDGHRRMSDQAPSFAGRFDPADVSAGCGVDTTGVVPCEALDGHASAPPAGREATGSRWAWPGRTVPRDTRRASWDPRRNVESTTPRRTWPAVPAPASPPGTTSATG